MALLLIGALLGSGWSPSNLRVERLAEREALGIDSAQPLLSWILQPDAAATRGAPPPPDAAVQVTVALAPLRVDGSATGKPADVTTQATELWSRGGVAAQGSGAVQYGGPPLPPATRVHWRVCCGSGGSGGSGGRGGSSGKAAARQCATASFVTGRATVADWGGAKWIGGRQLRSPTLTLPPHTVAAAVTVTGLGFYELLLNGNKVGDAVLDPGFSTNVTERILYATHDLTPMLPPAGAIGNGSAPRQIVLGARVGAGKYSYSVNPFAVPGKDVFALLLSLSVTLADGSSAVALVTDGQSGWQVLDEAPIVWENLYHGEVFDARKDQTGWADLGFSPAAASASAWRPAKEVALPAGADAALSARLFPPMRVVETLLPTNSTTLAADGSFFYDLGRNIAGVARVALPAGVPAGTEMRVVCTEYLDVAGAAFGPADVYGQRDTYIFSGAEAEGDEWAPTFVYHGFRYVRVDLRNAGLTQPPAVAGLFLHSDLQAHGSVTFGGGGGGGGSSLTAEAATLDAIQKMIVLTQRDNLHSIPTDCPQREKRGWMADAQWTAEEATLNFDTAAFYTNWVRTMGDLQSTGCTVPTPDAHGNVNMSGYCWSYPASDDGPGHLGPCNLTNSYCCVPTPAGANASNPSIANCSPQYNQSDTAGSVPDVVPNSWGRGGSRGWPGTPTWSSAIALIPGVQLRYGGDAALAARQYGAVAAHVAFLQRQAEPGYGGIAGVPSFGMMGDWCSIEPFCPGSSDHCLTDPGWTGAGNPSSSFAYIQDLEAVAQMAAATGKPDEAAAYGALLERARAAYYRAYFNRATGDFGPTQTGNAIGILASPAAANTTGAAAALLANLAARGGHIATGAVGSRWILQALVAAGHASAALDLATQTDAPSWFWFSAFGPGTMHENWPKGPVPSGTTSGSLNHIMFGGGIGVWLYTDVGGLRVVSSGGGGGGGGNGDGVALELGVDAAVMRRVGAAAARTAVAGGHVVRSAWRYEGATKTVSYNCTVPPMGRATLTLPWGEGAVVREGGVVLVAAAPAGELVDGVQGMQVDARARAAVLSLLHGAYEVTVVLAEGLE